MNSDQDIDTTWSGVERRSPPYGGQASYKTIIITVALAVMAFALDLSLPLGFSGGVPYVFFVLSGWWFRERAVPFILAAAASALIILGFFLSPEGGVSWVVLANRFLAILIIWATATVLWWAWRERIFYSRQLVEEQWYGQISNFLMGREVVFVSILMFVIIVSSWGVLSRIEDRAKTDIGKFLRMALETSHVSVRNQVAGQKNAVTVWANNSQIQAAARELAGLPIEKEILINNRAQKNLRAWLKPVFRTVGYRGFFIINKNNINLASTRDGNIGVVSLLTEQGDFLDRVWAGETLVSLPQISDVPLKDVTGKMIKKLSTMFVATPIRNIEGDVIAILAFRLEPDERFSPIFERGRFGDSGETYAFNKQGLMISESRFNEHLKHTHLISDGHSSRNVELRDPGVNLVLGQTPSLPRTKQPLTRMAQSATAGKSGSDLNGYRDYRGVPVVGVWLWDDELRFGIATEVDVEDAFASFNDMRFTIFIFSALIIGVLIVLAVASTRARKKITDGFERTRLLLSSVGDGVYGLDTDGSTTFVNPAACNMLGYEITELIGQPMHTLIHHSYSDGSNYPREECHMYAAFTDGEIHHADDEVLWRKDGSSFPVEYTSTPIHNNHRLTGAVVTFRDITERKEAEKQTRKAKEIAETANQAKSDFLSSMSHELRTPLNAILGFGQLLEHNPKEPLSDAQLDYTHQILKGGAHLLDLIDEVLELSKIEAGKIGLSIENVAPGEIINECISLVQTQADDKDVEIDNPTSKEDLPILSVDRGRFRQILLNLLSNAIKYNRDGGVVTITSEEMGAEGLRISVTDTGLGIPKQKQDGLFEPFNRLGREAGEIEGTGIGLTVTKKITELMDGQIGFESEEDEGSTFWIELPISDDQSMNVDIFHVETMDDVIEKYGDVSGVILYVEDDPANLELMKAVMDHLPNLVMKFAHSAELGVDVAEDILPDLILMDINLPGMNGIEALEILEQGERTRNIPVVAITAAAMPKDVERGKEVGFKDYLTKPINIPEVLKAVSKHIR